jgi:hypothetical protein
MVRVRGVGVGRYAVGRFANRPYRLGARLHVVRTHHPRHLGLRLYANNTVEAERCADGPHSIGSHAHKSRRGGFQTRPTKPAARYATHMESGTLAVSPHDTSLMRLAVTSNVSLSGLFA